MEPAELSAGQGALAGLISGIIVGVPCAVFVLHSDDLILILVVYAIVNAAIGLALAMTQARNFIVAFATVYALSLVVTLSPLAALVACIIIATVGIAFEVVAAILQWARMDFPDDPF